jgi:hypothetical protein
MKKRYLWLVRRAYRTLRHKRLRHRAWWRKLTKPLFERRLWMPCRDSVAVGTAIGMFFAVMPMPMQSVAAALIDTHADAAAVWLATHLLFRRWGALADGLRCELETAVRFPDAALAALAAGLRESPWTKEGIAASFKPVLAAHGLKMPQLAIPVRLLVFGMPQTPSVDACLALMPREQVLSRLSA